MITSLLSFIFRVEFLFFALLYKHAFKSCGKKFRLQNPVFITPRNIEVGDNVMIWKNARIEAVSRYNQTEYSPVINLGDEVTIQQNVHITCAKKICIGDETAIAANVSITDINHPYENINLAPEKQDIQVEEVYIGARCKIYNNTVILPGAHIGNHCIIGANSIVRKGTYPDYSILAGSPAKIIKKYNFNTSKWESYDN